MNLTARINYHRSEVVRLTAAKKHKAARLHALRGEQLQTVKRLRREARQEKMAWPPMA